MEVYVENHDGIDKSFQMSNNHISFQVDYDDVDHEEVDAATELLKEIMEKYWDENKFKEIYRQNKIDTWNKNEYNLQNDFINLEEYLNE